MIVRFSFDLPFALKEECRKELEKYIKQKISELVAKYGVFEVKATVKPKGAPEPRERGEIGEEKRYWFEDELEKEEEV